MGYVGNQTTTAFTSMAKQDITGDGGTGYTLDHAVANAQEIEVFVNNVRQEPGTAYTVSGTTLTMTGNVASTDDFYVVFQGKAIQTSVPGDNTVTTAMLQDTAVTAGKLAASLDMQNITIKGGSNDAITVDSSGRVNLAQEELFKKADGTLITRPHFIASSNSGLNFTHSHTSTNSTSFAATSGRQVYFPFSTVDGHNTSGFTTSATQGSAKYTAPVSGIYSFTAMYLASTALGSNQHLDTAFHISASNDAFVAAIPWGGQLYDNASASSTGSVGFTRAQHGSMLFTHGCNVITKLYEGQHIRFFAAMNTSFTQTYVRNSHNYWHGTLIGAI